MVEDLHGSGRVVDGGRERPDRDVDHHANRESGVLLDRPLDPEHDHRPQSPLRRRVHSLPAVHLEQRRSLRHEVAHRRPDDDQAVVCPCKASKPAGVHRLNGSRPQGRDDEGRGRVADVRARQVRRRVGPLGLPDHGLERASAGPGDERGDRDGAQPVDRAIQEHQEEENPGREEESGERHAEARHRVLLHSPEERVRERQGADEDGEHGLEQPVAIEDPHVARRERAGRHLHDQHGDRDDEPGEADTRADDRGKHGLRRPGRVRPALGKV